MVYETQDYEKRQQQEYYESPQPDFAVEKFRYLESEETGKNFDKAALWSETLVRSGIKCKTAEKSEEQWYPHHPEYCSQQCLFPWKDFKIQKFEAAYKGKQYEPEGTDTEGMVDEKNPINILLMLNLSNKFYYL